MNELIKENLCYKLRTAGYKISIQHYRRYVVTFSTCTKELYTLIRSSVINNEVVSDQKNIAFFEDIVANINNSLFNSTIEFYTFMPNLKRNNDKFNCVDENVWQTKNRLLTFKMLERGGYTRVIILTPQGETLVGYSDCSNDDNFNNKLGTRLAILNAIENRKEILEGI